MPDTPISIQIQASTPAAPPLGPAIQAASLLLCALQFAVYERTAATTFELVNELPEWLLRLVSTPGHPPAQTTPAEEGGRLTQIFPALHAFLPVAEAFWVTASSERLQSDFWTETDADGTDYHLLAYAITTRARHFLVIERADTTYVEHQQLQLYAHEMVIQYETITKLNQQVERATRAKSDFLATMSHEIRTPLNAILGMADLLAESGLNPTQQRYVEVFQRAGANLLGLINDILDLSKVEAGHLELEAADFELADVVNRALELTRVKASLKGLAVGSTLAPTLPPMLVGDPLRLRQVLLNLLGNAMKFTDSGRLQVIVAQDPQDPAPGSFLFAVKDSGIGIPADKLHTIFENFSQADTSTTRKYGGTGLGLAISKRIVELMHGRIWVESTLGQGSTFLFTVKLGISILPLPRPENHGTASPPIAPAPDTLTAHILLADDSDDNRFLIAEYLRNTPYLLDFAENGEVALQKMQRSHFDLVLMDAHMPVMDGYAATRALREWERTHNLPALPVLALTADAFKESVEQSALAGFNAHLTKPIRKSTLLEALRRHALVCDQPSTAAQTAVRPASQPAATLAGPASAPAAPATVDPSIATLVPRYLRNVARDFELLRAADESEDFPTIERIGHNLRGTGGGFGFPRLTEFGAIIEQAAKDRQSGPLRSSIADLGVYLQQVQLPAAAHVAPRS